MTRTSLWVGSVLYVVLLAGCEREGARAEKPAPAAATAPSAKATTTATAAAPAAAAPAAAAPAAAAPAGDHCGGEMAMAEGESCGQAGGGCNKWDEAAADVTKRKVPADAVWIAYDVTGMHCGGCERRIIAKVGEMDGILAVDADAELGRVRIAVAPGREALKDQARERITSLGYGVR